MAAYGPLPARQAEVAPHPRPFIRDDRPVERRYDERRDDNSRYRDDDRCRDDDDDDQRRYDRDHDRDDRYRGKKKRESFLSGLLDFSRTAQHVWPARHQLPQAGSKPFRITSPVPLLAAPSRGSIPRRRCALQG